MLRNLTALSQQIIPTFTSEWSTPHPPITLFRKHTLTLVPPFRIPALYIFAFLISHITPNRAQRRENYRLEIIPKTTQKEKEERTCSRLITVALRFPRQRRYLSPSTQHVVSIIYLSMQLCILTSFAFRLDPTRRKSVFGSVTVGGY